MTLESSRALVVTSSRNFQRRVTRALVSAGFKVDAVAFNREEIGEALGSQPTICIIDADGDRSEVRSVLGLLYQRSEISPLVVACDQDVVFLHDLLINTNLNNLIAKQGGISSTSDLIDETEMLVTCLKLDRRDIFGLEKYLPSWAIRIHQHEIHSTDEKRAAIVELDAFLKDLDCYGAISDAVLLVSDELLMNAIFNAPRLPSGEAKYALRDRRELLQLDPSESVELRYACDGRYIAVSVTDRFGSLNRDVLVRYLQRSLADTPIAMEEKQAGAGLGIYMVLNSITQLVFNVHVGVKTEVIALFYVRSGSRAFRLSGRSLNLFFLK